MFRHVVILHFVDDASAEQRQELLDALAVLPAAIPEIRAYQVGVDAGLDVEGNADLAIVADFDDVAGYVAYRDHPRHQDVLQRLIRPILGTRAAVQHEMR